MKLLIDSSTNYLFLAIIDQKKVKTMIRCGKNDHSETLVDTLNNFLSLNGYLIKDVKEIYIGRGPGSYTGLRIAGTVGKVLAHINGLMLYSFSSLDLILASVVNFDGQYLLAIDAKKNHSYYKTVIINQGQITCSDEQFAENSILTKNPDYQVLTIDEKLFANSDLIAMNILKYHLYRKEDEFDYTPNYIRSGI